MIDVEIEDAAWTAALPQAEQIVRASSDAVLVLPWAVPFPRTASSTGAFHVTILLTDDEAVRDLNARFRGKDAPTNVLSFPTPESAGPHLGDVALAYGVCAREAAEQGKPLAHHLSHLVAHGVLHLLGYDHMNDGEAEDMEALERRVLAGLDIPDPYRTP